MTVLEIVGCFASVPLEDRGGILAGDYQDRDQDLWPLAAAAAVRLAGYEDAGSLAELREGVEHFKTLVSIGLVDGRQWWQEICDTAQEAGLTAGTGGLH